MTDSTGDQMPAAETTGDGVPGELLAVRMLHDRLLVSTETEGERRSGGGILIPATVRLGRKLGWAKVMAVGENVRSVQVGDRVLFDPEDKSEVELRSRNYVLLRERDLHAVAQTSDSSTETGLYL